MDQPLFHDPTIRMEKVAYDTRIDDDVEEWPTAVVRESYKQLPFLKSFETEVELDKIDSARGFGVGKLLVWPARMEKGAAAKNKQLVTVPVVIRNRELAPLAGVYPALRLGPAWWFHDSPEGMRRFREMTTETAGFYNTVGFNDDTRAFPSIPARHDVSRRVDCAFLARLVAEHRLEEEEAFSLARELAYTLAKEAYRL